MAMYFISERRYDEYTLNDERIVVYMDSIEFLKKSLSLLP